MQGCATKVQIEGEELELLADHALFWPSQAALLVADLHVGKGTAFRAQSVPLPAGSSESTLSRLSFLLQQSKARRLFLLGDFWHAKQGRTNRIDSMVGDWRCRHEDVEMTLVEGNHDKRSGELPVEFRIASCSDCIVGPFVLKHHPDEDDRGYVLCGHIHPAVRLIGAGRQTERLPAFWFGKRVGVLPAFGDFTGAATVYPSSGDRVFVVAGSDVVEVGLTGAGASVS